MLGNLNRNLPASSPGGGGGGGVASVTASSPLVSSGGANPDISLTGGLRTVTTTVARNNIAPAQLVEGMEVYVIADGNTYRLNPGFPTPPVDGSWSIVVPSTGPITGVGSAESNAVWSSGTALSANILWVRSNATGIVSNVQGFSTSASPIPGIFSTPTTLVRYVDSVNGNDANTGLAAGAGTAWATIAHALNQIPMVAGGQVTINLADGTYPETIVMRDLLGPAIDATYGNSIISFVGNAATPANVIWQSATVPLNIREVGATVILDGITLNGGGGSAVCTVATHGQLVFRNVNLTNAAIGLTIGGLTRFTWEAGAAGGAITVTGTGVQLGGACSAVFNRGISVNGYSTHGISASGSATLGGAASLTWDFNGAVGASDGFQSAQNSVIALGSSNIINFVNCSQPYRVINGGTVTLGNGPCVSNFNNCGSGGQVTENSYFQDGSLTGNTFNYLGTTPAVWSINSNATVFAPGTFSGATMINNSNGGYVMGSFWHKQGTITADTTLNSQSYSIKCNAAGAIAVTLPLASTMGLGRVFIIADISGAAAANNITLTASGGDLINGGATYPINTNYGVAKVEAISGGWSVI